MRFTLQALNAAPRLKGFLLDILSNLVNKQVWPHSSGLQDSNGCAYIGTATGGVQILFLRISICLLS